MNMANRLMAREFRESLLKTFSGAFDARVRGERIEALMIDYDIQAANADLRPSLAGLHRNMIREGCKSCDAGVTRLRAVHIMDAQLLKLENEMFKERHW